MTFSKYKIHHLDLSGDVHPVCALMDQGHYCVFWYRGIPLGEIYLFQTAPITAAEFWNECIRAISPALIKHASQNRHIPEPLPVMQPDLGEIQRVCEQLLDGMYPRTCDQADVSVVICTRNRAASLRNCLEHLKGQYCQPREIIVVDNASLTGETRLVAEAFNVRYIREDKPGLDVARNTGARAAHGAIVAYTDDDTRPDHHWIYRIAETFSDPAIAAMTGLVIAASLQTEAEVIFEKFWPFNRGYVSRRYDAYYFRTRLASGPPVWEIGAGANMAFRKEIFARTGFFDERLDVGAAGCNGDSELWYRILASGFTIQYNPLAVVYHNHRDSLYGLKKQLYAYMRGYTVAILIQYQRFGHRGNLRHLKRVLICYARLLKKEFPRYQFQYRTLFAEVKGVLSGLLYYARHRNTDAKIYHDVF